MGRTLRWSIAMAVGILFHVVLFWSVRTTVRRELPSRSQKQFAEVEYFDASTTHNSESLAQQMSLFDPRPLMLPTQWNSSNVLRLGEFTQEERDLFPAYEPLFELEEGDYLDDFGTVPASYESLTQAQSEFDRAPLLGIGRGEVDLPGPVDRRLTLVLRDSRGGNEIDRFTFGEGLAERLASDWPSWEPIRLLGLVEDSFLSGQFSIVKSSGYIDVDNLLSQAVRVATSRLAGLDDGFYLLEITP